MQHLLKPRNGKSRRDLRSCPAEVAEKYRMCRPAWQGNPPRFFRARQRAAGSAVLACLALKRSRPIACCCPPPHPRCSSQAPVTHRCGLAVGGVHRRHLLSGGEGWPRIPGQTPLRRTRQRCASEPRFFTVCMQRSPGRFLLPAFIPCFSCIGQGIARPVHQAGSHAFMVMPPRWAGMGKECR